MQVQVQVQVQVLTLMLLVTMHLDHGEELGHLPLPGPREEQPGGGEQVEELEELEQLEDT